MRRRAVEDFPWGSLERVERVPAALLRGLRRSALDDDGPARLERALGALLEAEIALFVERATTREPPRSHVRVGLATLDGERMLAVVAEPALVTALLSRLLRRPVPLIHPEATLEPALHGAFSALVLEALRAATGRPFRLATASSPSDLPRTAPPTHVELRVSFEGRGYAAGVVLPAAWAARGAPPAAGASALARLRFTEIELPLVIGVSASTPRELSRLERGGAFLPGTGLWIDRSLAGRAALVAPLGERGSGVEISGPGRIVLRGPAVVPHAPPEARPMSSDPTDDPVTLVDTVLDAPLVVRLELGSISMSARDWSRLAPGDVIETGRPLGERIALRAGGRVLGHGELVDVEGELGVRITDIAGTESE